MTSLTQAFDDSGQRIVARDDDTRSSTPARGRRSGGGKPLGRASGHPKSEIPCRFFQSQNGCRAGDSCPYLHDSNVKGTQAGSNDSVHGGNSTIPQHSDGTVTMNQTRRYQAPRVVSSKVVPKPVTQVQVQDPRKYQLDQLKRRFKVQEENTNDQTILSFQLHPSDPDFPFELDGGLQCKLHVPKDYPQVRPSIQVMNAEMGRGFQINVERGFDEIVHRSTTSTLLGSMNALDRQLELLLSGEKADTIKIVRNSGPKEDVVPPLEPPPPSPPLEPILPAFIGPTYSYQQISDAEAKRKIDVRQLEARLGRLSLFEKAADGLAYMVPVEPRRREQLPVPLQSVKSAELVVPRLYPLEPCRIRLFGVPREAAVATEANFVHYVKKTQKGNLLSFLNYLGSSMHTLATTPVPIENKDLKSDVLPDISKLDISKVDSGQHQPQDMSTVAAEEAEDLDLKQPEISESVDLDRPHLHFISRPPEWSMPADDGEQSSDTDSTYSGVDYEEEEDAQEAQTTASQGDGPERGVLLSFPSLELHGVELLELVSVALTLRCLRCKDTLDVHRIRNDAPKTESCKKCIQPFVVSFRREFMHTSSIRAGHFDLDGCTIVDLLPSSCSSPQAPPGVVSVRGESTMAICRECHGHMSFKIPEVKFLQVSANVPKNRPPPRRKARENLGVTAGEELPNRGRCEHYRKSYRWFRFSCCNKVFPCDRCHDGQTDHPNEHANRMLCGWCSREQLYRPETCAFCRNPVIGKRAGGFWEGGKGTRDKNLMSRKDPRKWKRRAAGVPPGHNSTKK